MSNATTVLLCGVGGQGTVLAADLLARTALASNYDVKVSEIHGMSQRGGAVTTVVRFGTEPVATMVADHGCVDCVVSFETTEALRNLPFVREGGYLLVADEDIKPLPVLTGKAGMPENAREKLQAAGTGGNLEIGERGATRGPGHAPGLLRRGMEGSHLKARSSQNRRSEPSRIRCRL